MKNSKKTTPASLKHSVQIGNHSSVRSKKVLDPIFSYLIQQAIQILGQKGYIVEYVSDGVLFDGEPYILFKEDNSNKAFCTIPEGFKKEKTFEHNLCLTFDIESSEEIGKQLLTPQDAAEKFLRWARLVPKAVTFSFEIDVPEGEDPDDFAVMFEEDASIYGYEIQSYDEDGDVLMYSFTISPDMLIPLSRDIELAAKDYETTVSISSDFKPLLKV